ncbi:hypothetical protein DVK85_08120 [Flavobacterium arcticum]|uniref:Lipoprotein n=1 Tax=Flavobacterium arcticum TaxID=1784713 RepID=A0A345HC96_9FLAO|nr:hypothetical protein [Flavobacterium arcticum]AXG74206.1 hypothetical protein DVK85_08120 [Flavobacterium arcticum]KAF2508207.1 hypothetical protein E0W72_11180 [Flavobacterium arcticum]
MKYKYLYIVIFAATLISCSEDKATNSNDTDLNQISLRAENAEKGSVPEGMFIKKVLSGQQEVETLSDLITLYKQDVNLSKGSDYDTNLKNMWMILIYKPLISEGTEQQKTFFIHEQLTLDHNLPHLEKFVNLLLSTESIDTNEKDLIFEKFFSINKTAINSIIWKNPEEKAEKNQELVMLGRNYGLINKSL